MVVSIYCSLVLPSKSSPAEVGPQCCSPLQGTRGFSPGGLTTSGWVHTCPWGIGRVRKCASSSWWVDQQNMQPTSPDARRPATNAPPAAKILIPGSLVQTYYTCMNRSSFLRRLRVIHCVSLYVRYIHSFRCAPKGVETLKLPTARGFGWDMLCARRGETNELSSKHFGKA